MQALVVRWHRYPRAAMPRAVERKRIAAQRSGVRALRALHARVCVRALPRLSSPSWARSTRVWPSSARAAARPSAHRSAKRQTLRPPPQSAAAAALRERALPKGAVLTRCDLLAEGHCDAAAAVKRAERVPVCAYVQPSRQASGRDLTRSQFPPCARMHRDSQAAITARRTGVVPGTLSRWHVGTRRVGHVAFDRSRRPTRSSGAPTEQSGRP